MPRLSIFLLGPFHATLDGRAVTAFEYDPVRALLAFLAVESDRPHRREALAGLLWPDQSDRVARNNLRNALFTLRRTIGDAKTRPHFLETTRDTVQFNPQSDYTLDVNAFNAHLDACAPHRHRSANACPRCAAEREQAAALYRGNFLEQFSLASPEFEAWTLLQRERLRQRALGALFRLGDYHTRRQAYESAAQCARRQLELDPWREESHRQLMRALALAGQRSAALAQYDACKKILAEELGAEPSEETTRLDAEIRDQGITAKPLRALPLPATSFVGRVEERAQLADRLNSGDCRLATLVGPGGIGKTRLALQVAHAVAPVFDDGACFVPLAEVSSPDLLAFAIADALALTLTGKEDPRQQLVSHLRDQDLLLVLDNFEHLLVPPAGGGEELVADILRNAPRVSLLATSRERLNLQSEWVFDVPGLGVPRGDLHADARSDALALFTQRAQMVRADFALTDAARAGAVRVCQLLEGMPLGIELVAVWVRHFSCDELARQVADDLARIAAPLRDLPERHRSIRAAFEHSWRLLSAEEQRALARVSVFRGGFEAEAAEAVWAEEGKGEEREARGERRTLLRSPAPLPDLLTALADKSLAQKNRAGRYTQHELVRRFAEEKLRERGEAEGARRRHLDFFLSFAERIEPQLTGPAQAEGLAALDAENDNLRAALEWSLAGADVDAGLRLCAALWRFWWVRGHQLEGRAWLARALALTPLQTTRVRANALGGAGTLAWSIARYDEAQRMHEECLALLRQLGDQAGAASSLNNLGLLAWGKGELERAAELFEESLAIQSQVGNKSGIASALGNLALVRRGQHDYARALQFAEESLALERAQGNQHGIARQLNNLGLFAYEQGDLERARAWQVESLSLRRAIGNKVGIAASLEMLGRIALQQGDYAHALTLFTEALTVQREAGLPRQGELLYRLGLVALLQNNVARAASLFVEGLTFSRQSGEVGEVLSIVLCLEGLARATRAQNNPALAARLLGAAQALRQARHWLIPPVERAEHDRAVQAVRAQLGAAEFEVAFSEGCALTVEQAEQLALDYFSASREAGKKT
jgi:predicted ATPase